jgi:hypothetical protein
MPSPEQLENDVREVLEFCRNYRGIHEDVFTSLRGRLSEIDQLFDEPDGQRREHIGGMYVDAISTLLLLADPPGRETYAQVLDGMRAVADTPITAVRFYTETPIEAVAVGWESYDLQDSLPERRSLTTGQREILDFFRSQLPAAEASDPQSGGERDG